MRKLITAIFILLCQITSAQNLYFTKKTDCAFEFSLSKKFVKSSVISYYSNSDCFDTVLTNKKGIIIHISATDLTKNGYVDSTDHAKLEMERFKKDLSHPGYYIDSTSNFLLNGITFRKMSYHEKKSKFNRGYNYHTMVIFNIYHSVLAHLFIDMQQPFSTNPANEIVKTIKRKW